MGRTLGNPRWVQERRTDRKRHYAKQGPEKPGEAWAGGRGSRTPLAGRGRGLPAGLGRQPRRVPSEACGRSTASSSRPRRRGLGSSPNRDPTAARDPDPGPDPGGGRAAGAGRPPCLPERSTCAVRASSARLRGKGLLGAPARSGHPRLGAPRPLLGGHPQLGPRSQAVHLLRCRPSGAPRVELAQREGVGTLRRLRAEATQVPGQQGRAREPEGNLRRAGIAAATTRSQAPDPARPPALTPGGSGPQVAEPSEAGP